MDSEIDAYNTTYKPMGKDEEGEMSDAENKDMMARNIKFGGIAKKREEAAKARQANNQKVKEGLIW